MTMIAKIQEEAAKKIQAAQRGIDLRAQEHIRQASSINALTCMPFGYKLLYSLF